MDFQEKGPTQIMLGNFHIVDTLGTRSIRLNTHGGSVKIKINVRFVPNPHGGSVKIMINVIFVPKLKEISYQMGF